MKQLHAPPDACSLGRMYLRFTLILLAGLSLPAAAQTRAEHVSCDDSKRMTHRLRTVIGAERQATGLRDPDTMLEVWVARRSGDWMIVQSYANGTSCIIAMGAHWEAAPREPA